MHGSRRAAALLLVIILFACPAVAGEDCDAASPEPEGLLLHQVNPKGCEGVAVRNFGPRDVDMADYAIADMPGLKGNEGVVTFDTLVLPAGSTLVLASSREEGDAFSNQEGVLLYGDGGDPRVHATSRFVLNNAGDDVYLMTSAGEVLDAVFYGNVEVGSGFWTGPAVKAPGDRWIQRVGLVDTDSADDWAVWVPGSTSMPFDPDVAFDSVVTPFLFPEDGGIPVYRALESAASSIWVNMYQITSLNVLGLLCRKASEGVDVRLLIEGGSLHSGADPVLAAGGYLSALDRCGGEVRLIGGPGGRYTYDHAKYAVVDGSSVVVTSENWTPSNMSGRTCPDPYSGAEGNRGWGAVVSGPGYAGYMAEVFLNDWSDEYGDVCALAERYPNLVPSAALYDPPGALRTRSYRAEVTPVLSYDNSLDALEHYVGAAAARVYSEQQSLGSGYLDFAAGTPLEMMRRASARGADCRLVFGTGVSSNDVAEINARSDLKAALMERPYVHNKGLVCDDCVWISSINWTQASFERNREVCAVVRSAEVSDFFAESFLEDFGRHYSYGGFALEVTGALEAYAAGEEVALTVEASVAGRYTYTWDLGDGSDPVVTQLRRIVARPAEGVHTLTVTATDSNGFTAVATWVYRVGSDQPDGNGFSLAALIPYAMAAAFPSAAVAVRFLPRGRRP